ncbi:MAG: AAA family ATPase, partial [Chloroflexi bacterium]|nr:AAA family ATPase [Chloroflexota bacterium]
MSIKDLVVPPEQLTRTCDPEDLGIETTDEIAPLDGTIGQERALSALELGLDIDAKGFNLFISGAAGTGRSTALRSQLERIATTKPIPPDWGYVNNFDDASEPIPIKLPCGMMRTLAQDMKDLVEETRREVPKAFESDEYTHRIEDVTKDVQTKRQELTDRLDQEAQSEGFALAPSQAGITPVPLTEGRPMTQEEFAQIPDEIREGLREKADRLQHSITHVTRQIARLGKEVATKAKEVDIETVQFTLTPMVNELQEKYSEHPEVVAYLDRVEADMVQNADIFKPKEAQPSPFGM